MRIFFTFILFLVFQNFAPCAIEDDIFYINPDGSKFSESEMSYPKITDIEMRTFNQKFTHEPLSVRLNRLEAKVFDKIYDNQTLSSRVNNITNYFDKKDVPENSLKILSKIERKIYGREQNSIPIEARIEKLEATVFGMFQAGELKNRISMLERATVGGKIAKDDTKYQSNYPYGTQNKSIFQRFKRYDGALTGYSPPPYNPYSCYVPNAPTVRLPKNYKRKLTPYQAYTLEQMQKVHQNNDPFFGGKVYNDDLDSLFSADVADESYNSDGTFRKYKSKSHGGIGVKIIRD